jgi:hypothetical protein
MNGAAVASARDPRSTMHEARRAMAVVERIDLEPVHPGAAGP